MRIAIAGFGIGGGALSVALARDGHAVTVFEQASSPGPVGAGFLLQPSGQAALASLDLLDRVAAEAWQIRAFHAESSPGRTLTLLRYDRRDPGSFALGVARGRLFSTLMDAATSAGVRVVTGVRIVTARETGDTALPIDDAGAEHGPFDILVGADGMRSALRRRVDPGSRGRRWRHARYAYLSRALSPFFQSSHGWLGPARDVALPAMGAVRPLRWFMEHVLAGRG